jgi:hypothetical protein
MIGGVSLPQYRTLTDADGFRWTVTVDAGRLVLTRTGEPPVVFERPEELRSLAPQLVRAVTEHRLGVQAVAAKASADSRLRRQQAGQPTGLRHRPFVDPPDPPAHRLVDEVAS